MDLPVTILVFFGLTPGVHMCGKYISTVLEKDEKIHEGVLFGMFGSHVCYTDGRYVYIRKPRDYEAPLYEHTLMPTHMMHFFSEQELRTMEWHPGFNFTNIARGGFKHHTSVGVGHKKEILKEAFTIYLGYDWVDID